jgi:hypothetical protein
MWAAGEGGGGRLDACGARRGGQGAAAWAPRSSIGAGAEASARASQEAKQLRAPQIRIGWRVSGGQRWGAAGEPACGSAQRLRIKGRRAGAHAQREGAIRAVLRVPPWGEQAQ